MKRIITLLTALFVYAGASGQDIDTLRVLVLCPQNVEVSNDFRKEYKRISEEVLAKRKLIKAEKLKEQAEHQQEYDLQPRYTKQMFENVLSFYDSLTIDNYISMIVREYIAYRLYRPYKIKPRLVLLSGARTVSEVSDAAPAAGRRNLFIICFPLMKISGEDGRITVRTRMELYAARKDAVLYAKELTGIPQSGLTDYPMCSENGWDCAFVNSCYPGLPEVLELIVANKQD